MTLKFSVDSLPPAAQHALRVAEEHFNATPRWVIFLTPMVLLFGALIYQLFIYHRFVSPLRSLPGPDSGHWLYGHMGKIITEEAGIPHIGWNKTYGEKGVFRVVGPFGMERLTFTSYKALKHILVDKGYQYPKPYFAKAVLGQVTGKGLLYLENSEHKDLRRFINPAFATKYLKEQHDTQYYVAINRLVEEFNKQIDASPEPEKGTVIDCYEWGSRCLLDIIGLSAFGLEVDCLRNEKAPLHFAYSQLIDQQSGPNLAVLIILLSMPGGAAFLRFLNRRPWSAPLIRRIGKFVGRERISTLAILCESMYIIQSIAEKLLEEKTAEARKLKEAGAGADAGKVDILSLVVKASLSDGSTYQMSQELMTAQILTFLGAGHETTAAESAWILWLLVNNKEAQARCREECQALLRESANPTYAQLKELKYLEAVVQEAIRVKPSVPGTVRQASQDDWVDGTYVPKGTLLYIGTRVVNTDPRVWGDDAAEFRPERWFDLPEKYDATFSVLTFIAGPHHCIGRAMAVSELKALICSLVGNFEFDYSRPGQTVRGDSAITMKPRDGLNLLVKRSNPLSSH